MRALALLTLLAACTAKPQQYYSGDPRPAAEVATVHCWGVRGGPGDPGDVFYDAWIVGVNGRKLDKRTHELGVLPGKYTFQIRYKQFEVLPGQMRPDQQEPIWQKTDTGVLKRELVVEAGKIYELHWTQTFQNFRTPEFRERGLRP